MSAVEEIKAAIEGLTELRDAATPGQRAFSADWFDGSQQALVAVEYTSADDLHSAGRIATFDGPHLARARNDALLIAALHRTIDAQIALLGHTVEIRANYVEQGLAANWDSAVERAGDLALARAINGVTS
jgi:hypothetical protein